MEIIKKANARHVVKPDRTKVDYYLFPEYEIHYNEVPPGTIQVWHHHEVIEEAIFIISGQLEVKWREKGREFSKVLSAGDLVRTGTTPHTFVNSSSSTVLFLVVKLVLEGNDKSNILKHDKQIDE